MSVLFNHARRYGLFHRNPINVVRASSKRQRIPDILTIDEIQRLLLAVKPLYRTLLFTDVVTGLRQSELFGLKWGDIDFENGQISVLRSLVHGVTSPCKTEASRKPVPMEPGLATVLKEWKHQQSPHTLPDDWVFASRWSRGKKPMWGQTVIRKGIRPIAKQLCINKTIGWHTFRHSYATLLRSLGVDIKVQQELLRQSDPTGHGPVHIPLRATSLRELSRSVNAKRQQIMVRLSGAQALCSQ